MEQEQSSVEMFEKFTWKIENLSRLKTDKIYSEPFVIGGYPWKIRLYPRGEGDDDYLTIYLEAVKTANMSEGWSRYAKFKLLVFNQLDSNRTVTETEDFGDDEFNASNTCWGFKDFMKLDELNDPNKGFILEDACIVGAKVYVCKSTNEKQLNQANFNASLTLASQTSHMEEEVSRQNQGFQVPNLQTFSPVSTLVCTEPTKHAETFSPSNEELMDFSSVGQIEEICPDDPPLIKRPSKRSRNFTDFAFAALGRVLYFLKTRKVKDMNEQACKDLQGLWDELEKFKFDLTWLEPQVQYALGMKSYVEKALQLENLKENMVALELETETLNVKFAAAEVNLEKERDLLKAN